MRTTARPLLACSLRAAYLLARKSNVKRNALAVCGAAVCSALLTPTGGYLIVESNFLCPARKSRPLSIKVTTQLTHTLAALATTLSTYEDDHAQELKKLQVWKD